ncbi:MAG: hypothetical protein HY286_01830 [Planctomycetes bacterium]|nr:hypothetical protein [Planctomycetota bacterium]
MPRRPSLTILYIGAQRAARVDLSGPGVTHSAERPCGGESFEAIVESLLKENAKPAARTFIFSEDVFTQTIDLPASAVAGLTVEQVQRALSYELEPVSGVRAAEAAVGMRECGAAGDRRRYWVALVPLATRDAAAAVAQRHQSRIAGIAHPGGLLNNNNASLEVWEQATFCHNAAGGANIKVISARPGSRLWEQEVRDWLERAGGPVEWIGRARSNVTLQIDGVEINDRGANPADADLYQWIGGVAAPRVLQQFESFPVVVPPKAARAAVRPRAVGIAVAAALVALAALDYYEESRIARDLESEVTTAETTRLASQRAKASEELLTKQIAETVKNNAAQREKLQFIDAAWNEQRGRLLALATAAGEQRVPSLFITEIASERAGGARIRGEGADAAAIDNYAAGLAAPLEKAGWRAHPAFLQEKTDADGRRFYEFNIALSAPEAKSAR